MKTEITKNINKDEIRIEFFKMMSKNYVEFCKVMDRQEEMGLIGGDEIIIKWDIKIVVR